MRDVIGAALLLAALLALAAAVRALILAATRQHGRHEQRDICEGCAENDLHCAGAVEWCVCTCGWDEDWAEEDLEAMPADLRAVVPAPGLDYISDRAVRLPWTPPLGDMPGAGWQRPAYDLDEIRARFLAAQGGPVEVLPPHPPEPRAHYTPDAVETTSSKIACGRPYWQVVTNKRHLVTCENCLQALAVEDDERMASDTDVRTVTCAAPTSPAGLVPGEAPDKPHRAAAPRAATPRDPGRTQVKDRPGAPPAPDVAAVLPAWVVEALGGHDGVDACVDSIVARTVSDG